MALGEIIKKKKHKNVKFSDKTRPKKAVVSLFFALAGCILMGVMIGLSAAEDGQGGILLGAGGFGALLLAVIGIILAVRCFKMDNIYYGMPVVGAVWNGILILAFSAMYVVGFL